MTTQIRRKKGQRTEYPQHVTAGSVTVTIYEVNAPTNKNGKAYKLAWSTPMGRKVQTFADPDSAMEEARTKAAQLAEGRIEGAEMSRSDRDELQAARQKTHGKPLLSVLDEWLKAYELTGGMVLEAAKAWAQKHSTKIKRVLASDCVDQFIAAKEKAGKEGDRTYGSKLRPIKTYFKDRYLDEITTSHWTEYLAQWENGVTRNDFRKRAIAMSKWARDQKGYLPRAVETEIELSERAKEDKTEIGILAPTIYRDALKWMHTNHPEHLAALVVAGLCGVRADEIHGKRGDRDKAAEKPDHVVLRQTWEDIDLTEKHLNVTNAKENTPAWRLVPLCDAAVEWLKLCPGEHKGFICEPGAMEKIRALLIREAKLDLPDNCFRHSFITYAIPATSSVLASVSDGNKPQVAEWAGNSVKEINQRYRRPATKTAGHAWFASAPGT